MTEFFRKYYPVGVLILAIWLFFFLAKAPVPETEPPMPVQAFHTLAIETFPATEPETTAPRRSALSDPEEPQTEAETKKPETEPPTEPETHPETETQTITETEPITEEPEPEETEPPETEPQETEIPDEILLDVPYYSQKNYLPTGCETMSAKMLLEYYLDEKVSVDEIIDLLNCTYPEDIDGETYAPHPAEAFIGSPWDENSFGCYAPVMVNAMNQILPEHLEAVETTGTDLQELAETYVSQGNPVLVWETMNMVQTRGTVGWYLIDDDGNLTDDWYQWLANEHCMVLVGYDDGWYYFNDPLENHGTLGYHKDISEKRYEEQGMYSAVILKTED